MLLYEWGTEILNYDVSADDPDVLEFVPAESYKQALRVVEDCEKEGEAARVVLVRDRYGLRDRRDKDSEDLLERCWAYVKEGCIDVEFSYTPGRPSGIAVPKRFREEVGRHLRSVAR